jgi:CBS domain-containing protein
MLSNKVSEIMATDLVSASASSTVHEVIEQMVARDVGRIIIIRDDLPVGIFTERHVLKHVANDKLDPQRTSVDKVMTSPFRAVAQDTRIVDALGEMIKGKIRHLQVLGTRDNIIGIVSMRRILEIAVELGHDLGETQTIGNIITPAPLSMDESESVWDAVELMNRRAAGAVVVTSALKPVGLFTERDVLNRVVAKQLDGTKTLLKQVMSSPLIAMPVTALVGQVLGEMYHRDIRNMPIIGASDQLAGLVSMPDVLQYARAFDIDEEVRRTWKEIRNFYDSQDNYTPG